MALSRSTLFEIFFVVLGEKDKIENGQNNGVVCYLQL